MVTWILYSHNTYDGFSQALRFGTFQVMSILTTTGFTTADYETWPQAARGIDLYIEPILDDYGFGDTTVIDRMVEDGYQAAMGKLGTWQSKLR